jgi:DNA-binding transcriptional regulator YiaG
MDGNRQMQCYHYTESGLDYIWLDNGYYFHETSRGRGVSIEDLDGLHRAIGLHIANRKGQMTGAEVRFLRHELDWSQIVLANFLGVTDQTVARWEKGTVDIPPPEQKLLSGLYREHVTGNAKLRESVERIAQMDADMHESLTLHRTDGDWELCA